MEGITEDVDRQDEVDQLLIKILQRRMPYAREEVRDAARDIRELFAESNNALKQYLGRYKENGMPFML